MKFQFGRIVHMRLDKIHRQLELLAKEVPETEADVVQMMRIEPGIRDRWSYVIGSHSNVNGDPDAVALESERSFKQRPLKGSLDGTISAGSPGLGKKR